MNFDATAAAAARDDILDQVERTSFREAVARALPIVRASIPSPFRPEQVRAALISMNIKPHVPQAWGALFLRLLRNGTVVQTGRYVPAQDVRNNAHKTPEYEWATHATPLPPRPQRTRKRLPTDQLIDYLLEQDDPILRNAAGKLIMLNPQEYELALQHDLAAHLLAYIASIRAALQGTPYADLVAENPINTEPYEKIHALNSQLRGALRQISQETNLERIHVIAKTPYPTSY